MERRVCCGCDLDESVVECDFGGFVEQRNVYFRFHRTVNLLKNISNAFVGGSERCRFGERRKRTHRCETFRNFLQMIRLQGQHGIHLLCRVTLLPQLIGETVKNEFDNL